MKCLRCGYCCIQLAVVIVDNTDKGPAEDNLVVHEGRGMPCKHLQGCKAGEYSCAVHNEPWYEETPCAMHVQIERSPDAVCRMGQHVLREKVCPVTIEA